MPEGTVKFFDTKKGFGFITRDDAEDLFVHISNVEGGYGEGLEEGQRVEFQVGPGRKGDEARNVKPI